MFDFKGSLCLVTDRSFVPPESYFNVLEAVLDAGVDVVQLREKVPGGAMAVCDREFYTQGLVLRDMCRGRGIPLIVDDRLDMAMALDADGLHLGQNDLPLEEAKRIWSSGKIFGVTAATVEEAKLAQKAGADYIGTSAVFATDTKPEAEISGPDGLARLVQSCTIPVIAIGGVGPSTLADIMASGCAGIAVVSAIWNSTDPAKAAAGLKQMLTDQKKGPLS